MASLRHFASSASVIHGYGPVALRSAYNLSHAAASDGSGATVAIVSAFDDPHAASDLAVYRSHYRLRACAKATGCLRIVNEHGGATHLPATATAWASLDSIALDAVSALCPRDCLPGYRLPRCHTRQGPRSPGRCQPPFAPIGSW